MGGTGNNLHEANLHPKYISVATVINPINRALQSVSHPSLVVLLFGRSVVRISTFMVLDYLVK